MIVLATEVRGRRVALGQVAVVAERPMEDFPMPTCAICGRPANAHVTDMSDGTARNVSYCKDHLPAEMGALMPQSPAEEVALLREKLSHLDQSPLPGEFMDKARGDLEQLILDIEAGRRRLSDLL